MVAEQVLLKQEAVIRWRAAVTGRQMGHAGKPINLVAEHEASSSQATTTRICLNKAHGVITSGSEHLFPTTAATLLPGAQFKREKPAGTMMDSTTNATSANKCS